MVNITSCYTGIRVVNLFAVVYNWLLHFLHVNVEVELHFRLGLIYLLTVKVCNLWTTAYTSQINTLKWLRIESRELYVHSRKESSLVRPLVYCITKSHPVVNVVLKYNKGSEIIFCVTIHLSAFVQFCDLSLPFIYCFLLTFLAVLEQFPPIFGVPLSFLYIEKNEDLNSK